MPDDPYVDLVRRTVQRPTTQQIRAYAERVSGHHSWYKHLPLSGPGEPFLLYLNPHAHEVRLGRAGSPAEVWRPFVDGGADRRGRPSLTLDLRPGDLPEAGLLSLVPRYAQGLTTHQYRQRYGCWTYWNHGRPGQRVEEVLEHAAAHLRVLDDGGRELPVTPAALRTSVVYLRGTVSPDLGPAAAEYEALRQQEGLPGHEHERAEQLRQLEAAMLRVRELVYP